MVLPKMQLSAYSSELAMLDELRINNSDLLLQRMYNGRCFISPFKRDEANLVALIFHCSEKAKVLRLITFHYNISHLFFVSLHHK